jgi:3-phenylpropionate/trans-cinnamate dioxygenase ferredoxin subunit
MAEWVKVAQVGEVAPGQKKPIDLDGVAVLLFNVSGQYYAIEDVCTHDGAPLSGGRFNGTYIACPRHGARFCLRGQGPDHASLNRCYPVKIAGNDISRTGPVGGWHAWCRAERGGLRDAWSSCV